MLHPFLSPCKLFTSVMTNVDCIVLYLLYSTNAFSLSKLEASPLFSLSLLSFFAAQRKKRERERECVSVWERLLSFWACVCALQWASEEGWCPNGGLVARTPARKLFLTSKQLRAFPYFQSWQTTVSFSFIVFVLCSFVTFKLSGNSHFGFGNLKIYITISSLLMTSILLSQSN